MVVKWSLDIVLSSCMPLNLSAVFWQSCFRLEHPHLKSSVSGKDYMTQIKVAALSANVVAQNFSRCISGVAV